MEPYEIDWKEWQERHKPFGISGCIRVRNEAQFMKGAVLSHLPYLDEVVIVTQPSDDDTEQIANELAETFSNINVHHYPLIVDWIDTEGFYNKDPNQPGHLVHMSNWALSKCKYSWISKSEGDVICLSSFQRIVDAVKDSPDVPHYYGRAILNLAGPDCDQLSMENPTNGGWDEAVFNNEPSIFKFIRSQKWEVVPINAPSTCMGISMLHMKRCKADKADGWNGEHYTSLEKDKVREMIRPEWRGDIDELWDEIGETIEWIKARAQ
jgi:hypothetical protein